MRERSGEAITLFKSLEEGNYVQYLGQWQGDPWNGLDEE